LSNKVKLDSGKPIVAHDISAKLFWTEQKYIELTESHISCQWEIHAKRNTDASHFSFKIDHQENNLADLWLFTLRCYCLQKMRAMPQFIISCFSTPLKCFTYSKIPKHLSESAFFSYSITRTLFSISTNKIIEFNDFSFKSLMTAGN